MEGFVYMILNTANNKMYIGSTVNFKKRERSHWNGLRGKYHDNRKLQEEFNRYGEKNFTIRVLCETDSIEERFQLEEEIIQSLKTYLNGYNLSIDGRGKYIISENTKKKMRLNTTGERNPFYGKTHSEGTKKKLSEHASKRTGEKNSFYGKKHSTETLDRIAESFNKLKESGWVSPQKGIPKTPEAIHNNMMAQPSRKEVHAEGKNYPSISSCAKDLGVVHNTITQRIKSKNFPDYHFL